MAIGFYDSVRWPGGLPTECHVVPLLKFALPLVRFKVKLAKC